MLIYITILFMVIIVLILIAAVNFPRQAISLGVRCINPDRSMGTCEAYNECASFSIRAYIRGETGVCGFMPNGDPAVCCQVATNTGRPSVTEDQNNGGSSSGSRGPLPGDRQPQQQQPPPPSFILPGIEVGFDPNFGDLAARIRQQQQQQML
jgi:hypothetical protein